MGTNWPNRRDLKVFLFLVFIGYALLGVTIPLFVLSYPRFTLGTTWLWIVATPAMLASELGVNVLHRVLIFFNPFIYAAVWWSIWRLWRLFRRKPESE